MRGYIPPLPFEARRRLAKLVPLLGSNIDAEALGAVRAVGRVLSAAGSDWHALADMIGPSETEAAVETRGNQPSASPAASTAPSPDRPIRRPKQRRSSFGDLSARRARETITEILQRHDLDLSEVELLNAVGDRLYAAPHAGLSTSEVRAINRIWRRGEADATRRAAA